MSEEFEKWYAEVYLPEQAFEPGQREKSALRFAFEEGLHRQQSKIDEQAEEIKALRGFASDMFNYELVVDGHFEAHGLIDENGSPTKILTG